MSCVFGIPIEAFNRKMSQRAVPIWINEVLQILVALAVCFFLSSFLLLRCRAKTLIELKSRSVSIIAQ